MLRLFTLLNFISSVLIIVWSFFFEWQFATKVVSCDPIDDAKEIKSVGIEIPTDKSAGKVYQVILEDTILFPEGGGQVS